MTARQVATKAKRILMGQLGALPNWTLRDQEDQDDIGIDGEIEVLDSQHKSTGIIFKVQVKGRQRLSEAAGLAACRDLPVERVGYYLRLKIPVILILVDVARERIYWEILQGNQVVEGALAAARAKHRTVLTLHVPVKNLLPANAGELLEAVRKAQAHIAAGEPGVAVAALNKERERVERLDPRFRVHASADEKGQRLQFAPKEDVPSSVSMKNASPRTAAKLRALFNRGQPVSFGADEIAFSGSPLFEEVKGKRVQIRSTRRRDVIVDIVLRSPIGTELYRMRDVSGHLEGGLSEFRLIARLSDPVFELRSGWIKARHHTDGPKTMTMKYHFGSWFGKPLSQLPRFDDLYQFFCNTEYQSARLEIRSNGQQLMAPRIERASLVQAEGAMLLLDRIFVARNHAITFGLDPVLPVDLTAEHLAQVDEIEWLYSADMPVRPLPKSVWTFSVVRAALDHLFKNTDANGLYTAVIEDEAPMLLFDTPIPVGRVRRELRGMRLTSSIESLRELQRGTSEFVDIQWATTEQSVMVATKLDIKPLY